MHRTITLSNKHTHTRIHIIKYIVNNNNILKKNIR